MIKDIIGYPGFILIFMLELCIFILQPYLHKMLTTKAPEFPFAALDARGQKYLFRDCTEAAAEYKRPSPVKTGARNAGP